VPLGTDFSWLSADSIPFFHLSEKGPVDTIENMDGKKIVQSLLITSFDSGTQYIPPFEIIVNNQPFYTDSIAVQVAYTPFDPNADYRDIKEIIELQNDSTRYIPWMLAALALISAIALAIFFMKKRRSPAAAAPVVNALSAYDEAILALKRLNEMKPGRFSMKEYYSELNDILRRYVSREFNIATFERTNEELIIQMSTLNLSKDSFLKLAQSLRMSDFVKFAKYTPSDNENRENLEIVRASIDLMNKRLPSAV
jgi:hypothetical protein